MSRITVVLKAGNDFPETESFIRVSLPGAGVSETQRFRNATAPVFADAEFTFTVADPKATFVDLALYTQPERGLPAAVGHISVPLFNLPEGNPVDKTAAFLSDARTPAGQVSFSIQRAPATAGGSHYGFRYGNDMTMMEKRNAKLVWDRPFFSPELKPEYTAFRGTYETMRLRTEDTLRYGRRRMKENVKLRHEFPDKIKEYEARIKREEAERADGKNARLRWWQKRTAVELRDPLKMLRFNNLTFKPEDLMAAKDIVFLQLTGCRLGDQGMSWISAFLQQSYTVKRVCLQANDITEEGCKELFLGLRTTKTLMELDLSMNPIGVDGCAVICNALAENARYSKVYCLNMSACKLGPAAAFHLARLIRDFKPLQSLLLWRNNLGCLTPLKVGGVASIFEELRSTTTLKLLNLSANVISDTDAAAHASAREVERRRRAQLEMDKKRQQNKVEELQKKIREKRREAVWDDQRVQLATLEKELEQEKSRLRISVSLEQKSRSGAQKAELEYQQRVAKATGAELIPQKVLPRLILAGNHSIRQQTLQRLGHFYDVAPEPDVDAFVNRRRRFDNIIATRRTVGEDYEGPRNVDDYDEFNPFPTYPHDPAEDHARRVMMNEWREEQRDAAMNAKAVKFEKFAFKAPASPPPSKNAKLVVGGFKVASGVNDNIRVTNYASPEKSPEAPALRTVDKGVKIIKPTAKEAEVEVEVEVVRETRSKPPAATSTQDSKPQVAAPVQDPQPPANVEVVRETRSKPPAATPTQIPKPPVVAPVQDPQPPVNVEVVRETRSKAPAAIPSESGTSAPTQAALPKPSLKQTLSTPLSDSESSSSAPSPREAAEPIPELPSNRLPAAAVPSPRSANPLPQAVPSSSKAASPPSSPRNDTSSAAVDPPPVSANPPTTGNPFQNEDADEEDDFSDLEQFDFDDGADADEEPSDLLAALMDVVVVEDARKKAELRMAELKAKLETKVRTTPRSVHQHTVVVAAPVGQASMSESTTGAPPALDAAAPSPRAASASSPTIPAAPSDPSPKNVPSPPPSARRQGSFSASSTTPPMVLPSVPIPPLPLASAGADDLLSGIAAIEQRRETIRVLGQKGSPSDEDLAKLEAQKKEIGLFKSSLAAKLAALPQAVVLGPDQINALWDFVDSLVKETDLPSGNTDLFNAILTRVGTDYPQLFEDRGLLPVAACDSSITYLRLMLTVPNLRIDVMDLVSSCFFNQTCRIPLTHLLLQQPEGIVRFEDVADDLGPMWQEFFEDIASNKRSIPREDRTGRLETLSLMLDKQSILPIDVEAEASDGQSVLFRAAAEGDAELVKLLLSKAEIRGDIDAPKSAGMTVFLAGVVGNNVDVLKALFDKFGTKMNINATSENGNAMDLAVGLGRAPAIVEFLKQRGLKASGKAPKAKAKPSKAPAKAAMKKAAPPAKAAKRPPLPKRR